jgi:hypothetical protein
VWACHWLILTKSYPATSYSKAHHRAILFYSLNLVSAFERLGRPDLDLLNSPPANYMDHSAFPDEDWDFFNPLDVTMDSAQHARAGAALCLAVGTAIDADGPGPRGSIAGRKANMNRELDVGVQRMMTD